MAPDPEQAAPDPLKSFRGVMIATLVLEAIVVLLTLPWVAKLGSGVGSWQGLLVGIMALAHVLACGMAGRPWGILVALGLQVVLLACWFAVYPLGIVGVLFGIVWGFLWWFRHDVTKRMAEGRLPTQQSTPD